MKKIVSTFSLFKRKENKKRFKYSGSSKVSSSLKTRKNSKTEEKFNFLIFY